MIDFDIDDAVDRMLTWQTSKEEVLKRYKGVFMSLSSYNSKEWKCSNTGLYDLEMEEKCKKDKNHIPQYYVTQTLFQTNQHFLFEGYNWTKITLRQKVITKLIELDELEKLKTINKYFN